MGHAVAILVICVGVIFCAGLLKLVAMAAILGLGIEGALILARR